jgi:hypothetical protein
MGAPDKACTRTLGERQDCRGGTAARSDGVRVFEPFSWLEVGPVKVALSRPTPSG